LVRKVIKATDLFGRLSDEEFAIALLESNMEKGIIIAETLKQAIGI
jgi:GGDEF domain-containing protein